MWRKLAALVLAMTAIAAMGGCTFHDNKQAEIDFVGSRYRIYLYEKPTWQIAYLLRDQGCKKGSRETRGRCILTFLRGIDMKMVAKLDWNMATEGGRWDDIMDAIDDVRAGGTGRDSHGKEYAKRCLVVDRVLFSDPNWTFREGSDS